MEINYEEKNQMMNDESYFFEAIPNQIKENKEVKECLTKWGLIDSLKIFSFRFNLKFNDISPEKLFKDFFNDPNVQNCLNFVYKKILTNLLKLFFN